MGQQSSPRIIASESSNQKTRVKKRRLLISGAISGIISTLIFTIIHHILISDIWFSAGIMLIAGVLCGVSISWSYTLLFKNTRCFSFILYNLCFCISLMMLGFVSVLIFEPMTTVAAAIAANEPPTELIVRALPMTAIFTIIMALFINQLYARSWKLFGAILITCVTVISLLGLNVSAIGLVSFSGSSLDLIITLFALIFVLDVVYAGVFILLERKILW